jgi:hypothetical protein
MLPRLKPGRLAFGLGVGLLGMALMSLGYARVDKAPTFKTDPYPFVENLGQLADPEGRPLTEAYFTFEAPGMRGYVTRWGLTLFFYQAEGEGEEEEEGDTLAPWLEERKPDALKIAWERVDIELMGGCVERGRIRKGMPSVWGQNYYLGHCPQGILGVRGYGEVVVEGVWPGVDWVLRYDERVGGVKQEFVVQGGYRWDGVRLRIWSRGGAEVSEGRLRVRTAYGEFVEEGLVGYYGSERVGVRYRLLSERQEGEVKVVEVGYAVAGVPEVGEKTLVIDPVLQWGTYFGGSGEDLAHSVAVDGSGDVFVVGTTRSVTTFELKNPGGGAYYYGSHKGGTYDGFIAKFLGSNLSLAWSTYFGGNGSDWAISVAVDGSGNVFMVGQTSSTSNFPLANGGAYYVGTYNGGTYDAFIAKFSGNNLSLVWSTYFGGNGYDEAVSVAVDGSGDVFVVGSTSSTSNFPLANGGAYYVGTYNGGTYDAFIAKFLGSNLSLAWSTYFGGPNSDQATSVAVNGSGDVFVGGVTASSSDFPLASGGAYYDNSYDGGGSDAFIAKFSGSNLSLAWSTYFGGNGQENDISVAVDGSGNVFVVGWTSSTSNFPLQNPAGGAYYVGTYNGGTSDAFIAKFSGSNLSLVWSTYYGGGGRDYTLGYRSIAVGAGFIAVGALTYTTNGFPVGNRSPSCPGGFYQGTHGGGEEDLAILTFDLNGRPVWRTFYGGSGHDESPVSVAVHSTYLYVVGNTPGYLSTSTHLQDPGGGAHYDQTHNGGGQDAVLLRFDHANCPLVRWEEGADEGAGDGRGRWEAWWDGKAVRVAGIEAPGWYSVMGMDGRVVGRWYVEGEAGALEGPWSRGLYVVYREGSGESRRVYVGP